MLKPKVPEILTKREAEIAEVAAKGQTCAQIATSLHLSVNTVKTHIRHIYDKTGAKTRLQLYILLAQDSEGLDTGRANALY